MTRIKRELENWYTKNARKLPWRDTLNPYYIWISEVILQQTRVEQGLPFYYNFITNFPTIESLAQAPEDEVLKTWQGLGYYSRARNMIKAAQTICELHGGKLPADYEKLLSIPGIGKYTAAAVGSFAFSISKPAIDGNVRRVASRWFGLQEPIGTPSSDAQIEILLTEIINHFSPALFNQAMMELGATVCKPRNPLCEACPLQGECVAYSQNLQSVLPNKTQKKKPKTIHMAYLYLNCGDKTWIEKRNYLGTWKGLYEFPNIILEEHRDDHNPFEDWFIETGKATIINNFNFKHQLTHQTIFARLWQISTEESNIVKEKLDTRLKIDADQLQEYPIHRLMQKFTGAIKSEEFNDD